MLSGFVITLVCLGVFLGVAVALLFRAMGRRVRDDYSMGRTQSTRRYPGLARQFAIVAVVVLILGAMKGEWVVALGFGAFAAALAATFWLNKPKRQ